MARHRADPLVSGDPLDREPDVDGQAYAVADRHVQGLDAVPRIDRHGKRARGKVTEQLCQVLLEAVR